LVARSETTEGVSRINTIMMRHFLMNRMTLAARIRAAFVVTGAPGQGVIGSADAGDSPALGGVT
jgi:hypothetical protein